MQFTVKFILTKEEHPTEQVKAFAGAAASELKAAIEHYIETMERQGYEVQEVLREAHEEGN